MKTSTKLILILNVITIIMVCFGSFIYFYLDVPLLIIFVALILIALNVLSSITMIKSIIHPVKHLDEVAQKIAQGDFNMNVDSLQDDTIGKILKSYAGTAGSINKLTSDIDHLTKAFSEGNLNIRADASRYQKEHRIIVDDINSILETMADKISWYEAIIDAVPFPIHVTDDNMDWMYMNKAFEKLMVDQGVVKERKDGYGKACSHAGANICNTANCGIKQLQKGVPVSYFDWCGMSCKQDTSYLKNKDGKNIGYVEVVTDLTSILRVNEYSKQEIERLTINLDLLAKGDMNLNLEVREADEFTQETHDIFVKINKNLEKAGNAVGEVIKDTLMLSAAALEGKLATRADATRHQGDFRKIVEGVNNTLNVVIEPLDEAQRVMKTMSLNDFTLEMTGQYQGVLKEFAESINSVRERLVSVQDAVVRASKGDTGRLEEFLSLGKRSENDKLMPALIELMQTMQDLIEEAARLANAAIDGDLSIRGDAGKFEGGYTEIIKGMNRTMDAFAEPIEEAAAVLLEMEKGNLTVSMDGDYKGEYARIKEAINVTLNTFNDVLNEINSSAQQVATGARQISDSAQSLSQGSTEQASSVEELTASLEEVSVQTKQNAESADQANELAIKAKENAIQGNEQMHGMLKAMEEINESSGNISKIIKVIDDIAFQTNILALNAAVEAARAGQHGKGFAVVAEEVRNLAARSANAAKETTGLIEGSIKKAEGGTKIANETALALNKIVEGVSKAADLVGGIASASNEQAAAIAQINQGIMQVSQVTQTNSATSEESAAASEELSSQAELLNDMVSKFKLNKNRELKSSELSPEIMKIIEEMTESKRAAAAAAIGKIERKGGASEAKMKIALSDNEFGKY
jgi:methyl-accepting chemotaxis protein